MTSPAIQLSEDGTERSAAARVVVYGVCWNELRLLPYFLRNYAWAEKIVLLDNHSDDGSQELAVNWPKVEVRLYDTKGFYEEQALLTLKNDCWKELRGTGVDFAVVIDVDEFLYAEDLLAELIRLRDSGVTIVRPDGYNMVSDRFPEAPGLLTEVVTLGVPSKSYCKCCVFRPDEIAEINFAPGAHKCRPEGNIVWAEATTLKLLHMRNLGFEYLLERNAAQAARLSPENIANRWAFHVAAPVSSMRREFERMRRAAVPVV